MSSFHHDNGTFDAFLMCALHKPEEIQSFFGYEIELSFFFVKIFRSLFFNVYNKFVN